MSVGKATEVATLAAKRLAEVGFTVTLRPEIDPMGWTLQAGATATIEGKKRAFGAAELVAEADAELSRCDAAFQAQQLFERLAGLVRSAIAEQVGLSERKRSLEEQIAKLNRQINDRHAELANAKRRLREE